MALPKVQIKRTPTPNLPPSGLLPGELSVEMAVPTRLWVGVPTSIDPAGKKLLLDLSVVPNAAQVHVSDSPPASPADGTLWWESDTGLLFIYFNDGNTRQWVSCTIQGPTGAPGPTGPTGATGPVGPASTTHGQCRLKYMSTTEVRLFPHNGDRLSCNGQVCSIPLAGVALSNTGMPISLATTNRALTSNVETLSFTSVPAAWAGAAAASGKIGVIGVGGLVNKDGTRVVTAQTGTTLSFALTGANETSAADANGRVFPFLYVYAADINADGVVDKLEWSWTGYVLGTGGIFVKADDPTRTLVGLVSTSSLGEFVDTPTQRFVRSFFNPLPAQVQSPILGSNITGITATVPAERSEFRVQWLQFAHEAGLVVGHASMYVTVAAGTSTCGIWFDGDQLQNVRSTGLGDSAATNYQVALPSEYSFGPDLEGYHYASLGAYVGAGQSGIISSVSGVHGIIR